MGEKEGRGMKIRFTKSIKTGHRSNERKQNQKSCLGRLERLHDHARETYLIALCIA